MTSSTLVVGSISLLHNGHAGTSLLLKLSLTQQLQFADVHTHIFVSSFTISCLVFSPKPHYLTPKYHSFTDLKISG